ncbi:hypothetical protein PPUJ20028_06760 [Pseudomonas putida]|uniref:Uncharacterized protein n=1 Tax=Pseudomonas putida TaxID=303 RepID=A0AA37VSQ0_PSEPU|nr:hypothetical protein PPUJ20028_06760 [Pseudomonas putida]GLO35522.1 hypothetical protein PPUN14671_23550 [Pseudomonas putida]
MKHCTSRHILMIQVLKNDVASEARQIVVGKAGCVCPRLDHPAGAGSVEKWDELQKGRFTDAIGTCQAGIGINKHFGLVAGTKRVNQNDAEQT